MTSSRLTIKMLNEEIKKLRQKVEEIEILKMKVKDLESTLEVMKKQHGKIVKPRNEVSKNCTKKKDNIQTGK